MLKSNVRGESGTNAVMWILTLLIGIMCFLWMFRTIDPTNLSNIDLIESDLEHIQMKLSRACGSLTYSSPFNPLMLYGNLSFKGREVCIAADDILSCRTLTCETDLDVFLPIKGVEEIMITKDSTNHFEVSW